MKRYIPNLIPENYRVLPEYFIQKPHKQNFSSFKVLMWVVSLILFLFSIIALPVNIGFSFCVFLTALFICPWVHQILEKKLKFILTINLKVKAIGIISIFTLLTSFEYVNNLCELRVKIQVKAGQQQPI